MDENLLDPNWLDRVLWKAGLVRRGKWTRLASAYRDVWHWWEQSRKP